ncbi:uncharacterized protein [Penaeus vannamei]|uniref:uncharacterized protein n=1 Tax=Penaeus vannamei TaxID=6689 RepID=UPI00387F6743
MTEAERILALSPRQPLNGQRVLRISGFAGRGEMPNSTQIQAVKVGSLNVGTMSGKGREVVDLMERRKLEVLCPQETRWRGNKARELGRGFKLFYTLIAGDFNGHVGERNLAIERVHGRYGSGAVNPNGERLIDFAVAYDLAIFNTFF